MIPDSDWILASDFILASEFILGSDFTLGLGFYPRLGVYPWLGIYPWLGMILDSDWILGSDFTIGKIGPLVGLDPRLGFYSPRSLSLARIFYPRLRFSIFVISAEDINKTPFRYFG